MRNILDFFLDVLTIVLKIIAAIVWVIKTAIKIIIRYKKQIPLFLAFIIPILISVNFVFVCEIFISAPIVREYENIVVERETTTELKIFLKEIILYLPIILLILITIYFFFSMAKHDSTIIEKEDKPIMDEIKYLLTRMNLSVFAAYLALFLVPIFLFINIKYHLIDMKIIDLILNFSFSEIFEKTEIAYRISIIFALIAFYFFGIFLLPVSYMNETDDYSRKAFKLDFYRYLTYSKYRICFGIPFINILFLFLINRKIKMFIKYRQAETLPDDC